MLSHTQNQMGSDELRDERWDKDLFRSFDVPCIERSELAIEAERAEIRAKYNFQMNYMGRQFKLYDRSKRRRAEKPESDG